MKAIIGRVTVARIIALTVLGVVGYGPAAIAQSSSVADADDGLEEIVVTGSHIKRNGYADRIPVAIIDRSDFEADGAATFVDIVKFLPVNTGSFITQETGNLIGTSQMNVRGLGAGSTLTLINGRRTGLSAVADGNGNQFFDINQLPLTMIERIDVQTDGASAIYGSEAVAGVANIITRKGFEGLEITARYEDAANSGYSIGFASGAVGERSTVNLYASYYHHTRRDRTHFDWVVDRIDGGGDRTMSNLVSGTGAPGSYRQAVLDPITGAFTGTTGDLVPDPDCTAAGGILLNGRCRHSFADQVAIIPEEDRIQLFAEGEFSVRESVRAYTEVSFSHNDVQRTAGPNLFRNGLASGDLLIPADHPFNFFIDDGAGGLTYIGPEAWDNAINTAVPLRCTCRPLGIEFNGGYGGGSEFDREYRLNYLRGLAGVEIELPGSWSIDASYMYANSEWRIKRPYNYVASELNASIEAGTYNPFGTRTADPTLVSPKDGVSVAGFNRDDFNRWHHIGRDERTLRQQVFDVVATGDLFKIGGEAVAVAIGAQFRDMSFEKLTDALDAAGLDSTPTPDDPRVVGNTDVWAAFAEALIPLGDDVELTAAIRYEDYGGDVGSTTDPKIGARWEVNDKFALRATYGSSFQSPTVDQTSTSSSTAFIDDPASLDINGNLVCVDTGLTSNTTIIVGGDSGLVPQSADSLNFGVVLTPTDALQLSLDYWNFDYEDLIRPAANAQSIVNQDCADDGVPNDPRIERSPSGQIRNIFTSFINTGGVKTDGIDLNLTYVFPGSSIGDIQANLTASYVSSFDIVSFDDAGNRSTFDGAGKRNFNNPFGSVPDLRANLRFDLVRGNHSGNLAFRHIASYTNDQQPDPDDWTSVDSWTSIDLRYAYILDDWFGAPASIAVGINNIADEDPPTLGQGVRPGYDAQVHEIRGRLAYAEIRFEL
jgi:outer membrane receptor protein involved in Fe transport